VSRYTHGADRVLLDSSPFFAFAQAGQLIYLAQYLAKRAFITLEVYAELERNAATYADLQTLGRMRWPREENRLALSPAQLEELFDILRGIQDPGDHPLTHAGEISTVLMAEHLGGELIVLEDADGKQLARRRNVPRMSTAVLAAEMAAMDHLTDDLGFAVYDIATPDGVGRNEWQRAVTEAKAARPAAPAEGSATAAGC
jgi:predicted nucleic acid-binding protein